MIKNIIFDMGNVLIHFDPKKYVNALGIKDENEKQKIFNATYCTVKSALIDKGVYTEVGFVDKVVEDIGEEYRPYVSKLVLEWHKPIEPMEGMADLVKELKNKGYKIYLLSNAGDRQHEYWLRIPGHEYFDGTVVSCDVKAIKPEQEIYEALYKKFNIKPEESFFIDDLIINIYGAYKTGMDGYVFVGSADKLREELVKRNIL